MLLEFNPRVPTIRIHPETQSLCGSWGFCRDDYEAFGAAGMASKITQVHSLETMQKRYDKGELAAEVT